MIQPISAVLLGESLGAHCAKSLKVRPFTVLTIHSCDVLDHFGTIGQMSPSSKDDRTLGQGAVGDCVPVYPIRGPFAPEL